MHRTPERSQCPSSAFRIFPARHAAPDAGGLEVHLFVAEQRRTIERRLMVRTAGRLGIEQVYATLLTARNHQFATLERKDGWSHLHIEVTLVQPHPVRRLEPILQLELVAFHTSTDQPVAVNLVGRIISAVAR